MRPAPLSRLALLLPALLWWAAAGTALAQEAPLEFFSPVRSSLAPGAQESWHFSAPAGSMLSLVARAPGGELDPHLEVHDSNGALVARNDDLDWPASTDAVIEAPGLPVSGRYSVHVSNVGQGAGEYELTLLHGWSRLIHDEDFNDPDDWQASTVAADVYFGGRAVLVLAAPVAGLDITRALELPSDGYVLHADVAEVAGNRGWQLGIVSHWHDEDTWVRYTVDHLGQWRLVASTAAGERVLRDRGTHPVIQAGEKPASLGLASFGDGFELFYNQQSLGQFRSDAAQTPGRIGLFAGGDGSPGGHVTAWFSGLQVTAPARSSAGRLLPEQLAGAGRQGILRDLRRQGLVPGSGELIMLVPESYVLSNRAGVSTIRLGGEQQFGRFVLGADVAPELSAGDEAAGCGLILEATGPQSYTLAWLDNTGSAGLSRRVGDAFAPGPVRADLPAGPAPHQLLVVADGRGLLFYADGQFVGEQAAAVSGGAVGNAALSFANLTATCRFSDTWLWVWPAE